jgi:hypothetical protein
MFRSQNTHHSLVYIPEYPYSIILKSNFQHVQIRHRINYHGRTFIRVYPKVSGLSHKEINKNNYKHSLRKNTKGYGGKTH